MRRLVLALLAVAVAVLSACTAPSGPRVTAGCRDGCTGTVGGADYAIRVPAHWNGTLVLFSHGFRTYRMANHPALSNRDDDGDGDDPVSAALLARGYALAGSAYPSQGWVVPDAVAAAGALYSRFTALVARPRQVIAWGASMGGLITELLAERAGWVDAAAALCGAVAGSLPNLDNAVRGLVWAQRLTGVPLVDDDGSLAPHAATDLPRAESRLEQLTDEAAGAAQVYALAVLLDLPLRSPAEPGATLSSRVRAATENIGHYLGFGIVFLGDVTRRYGPAPARTDLAATAGTLPGRLTATGRADLRALGAGPLTLAAGFAEAPDLPVGSGRAVLARAGTPTGALRVPLLTVHTEDDWIIPAGNEQVLRAAVGRAGRAGRLVQTRVAASGPGTFPASGLGHCKFSTQQQIGAVVAVDRWRRTRVPPTPTQLRTDLGSDYRPG